MYLVRWSGGSVAFPVEGLDAALKATHEFSRDRAEYLLSESQRSADNHAEWLRSEGYEDVVVLRAGRQSSSKGWRTKVFKRTRITRNKSEELLTHDDAWILPEGFVDGDADKHGPPVSIKKTTSLKRTDAEKAAWYLNHKPEIKTCLFH